MRAARRAVVNSPRVQGPSLIEAAGPLQRFQRLQSSLEKKTEKTHKMVVPSLDGSYLMVQQYNQKMVVPSV